MQETPKPVTLTAGDLNKWLRQRPLSPEDAVHLVTTQTVRLVIRDGVASAVPYQLNGSWKILVSAADNPDRLLQHILRAMVIMHVQAQHPSGITNCYGDELLPVWQNYAAQLGQEMGDENRDLILSFLDKHVDPTSNGPTCNQPL